MTTIRTVAEHRGSLQARIPHTWSLLLVDETYTDSDSYTTLADVAGFEVTGGGYARDTLTGMVWDTSGEIPAIELDDAAVPGSGPTTVGAWVVDDDDDALLVYVGFDGTIELSGELPIEWAGGQIVVYDDVSADLEALAARTVAGLPFVDGDVDVEALAAELDPFFDGGGGGVTSVNGDTGPAVTITAVDLGAATEAFATAAADAAAAALVDSAPTDLDTLGKLAGALGDDPNFAATTAAAIGDKVGKDFGISGGDGLNVSAADLSGSSLVIDIGWDDSTDPQPLGTAAPGTFGLAARHDHVHPMPSPDDVGAVDASTFPVCETIALSDEATAITTGTAKVTWRAPWAFTLTAVRASVNTASSSGTPTFDINENGTTVLSTKLTIDASEKTSTTAATPAVISDASIADDAELTFDIDTAGTGAKGAKITLYGTRVL